MTYSSSISPAIGVTKLGANSLTLAAATTLGPLTVGAGTVALPAANLSIGGLAGGGNLVLGAPGTASSLTINGNSNSTFSGVISEVQGPSSLTKTGPNMLTLTGNNSYSGATTISQGILAAGPGSVGAGPIYLAGGTFQPAAASPGLTAQYYSYAGTSTAAAPAQPAGWTNLNTTSLSNFGSTYLLANGTRSTLALTDNLAQDVANGANGNFDFDTTGEGALFPALQQRERAVVGRPVQRLFLRGHNRRLHLRHQ